MDHMKNKLKPKSVKISGETYDSIRRVSKKSRRTIQGQISYEHDLFMLNTGQK